MIGTLTPVQPANWENGSRHEPSSVPASYLHLLVAPIAVGMQESVKGCRPPMRQTTLAGMFHGALK